MNRVGIGGLHLLDLGQDVPQWVDDRKPYMSLRWVETFFYSVKLAAKDGLEFVVFSSPGWSITGGPWVKPEQAMKKWCGPKFVYSPGKFSKAFCPACRLP